MEKKRKKEKTDRQTDSPGKWTYKSPSMGVPEKNKKKPPFGAYFRPHYERASVDICILLM